MTKQLDASTATFRMLASIGVAYARGALRIDESASREEREWLADILGKLNLMHDWSEMMDGAHGLHLELRASIAEAVGTIPQANAAQD